MVLKKTSFKEKSKEKEVEAPIQYINQIKILTQMSMSKHPKYRE